MNKLPIIFQAPDSELFQLSLIKAHWILFHCTFIDQCELFSFMKWIKFKKLLFCPWYAIYYHTIVPKINVRNTVNNESQTVWLRSLMLWHISPSYIIFLSFKKRTLHLSRPMEIPKVKDITADLPLPLSPHHYSHSCVWVGCYKMVLQHSMLILPLYF